MPSFSITQIAASTAVMRVIGFPLEELNQTGHDAIDRYKVWE
jgi:hypothetical protein